MLVMALFVCSSFFIVSNAGVWNDIYISDDNEILDLVDQLVHDLPIVAPHRTVKFDRYEPVKKAPTLQSKQYIHERDTFVNRLLNKMSITEKIGQMTQLDITTLTYPNSITINQTALDYITKNFMIGSFLNSPVSGGVVGNDIYTINSTQWMAILKDIQDATMEASPNKIPMIYGLDSVHGANYVHGATLFPHNIGLAATFNPTLAQKSAEVTSKDTSAVGVPWVFAPVLGIGVQPLWSRIYETFGEDPVVASVMGSASVKGFQGGSDPFTGYVEAPYAVCTAKHFFGYSDPHSGKDRTPAWIPERMLRRYFLPSFAAAINEGAGTIMINSGEVNGVPMHADKKYLTDVLRDELEFEGVAVTDWMIEKLVYFHHVAANPYEAIAMALDAGIDMSMVPLDYSFPILLKEMVDAGIVPESRLDISVRRILNLKYSVGLFKNPYPNPSNEYLGSIGSIENRELAATIVQESIVLCKNKNNVLPLNPSELGNILVTGPSAASLKNLNGGWSIHWQGAVNDAEIPYGTTILGGVQQLLNQTSAKVVYELGTEIGVFNQTGIQNAADAAGNADAVILVIGELPQAETPGDVNDLSMDPSSVALLQAVIAASKGPVILVLVEARPRIIDPAIIAQCDAVLMAFLPGSEGGKPIADIIFGSVNPSGKMPYTYPGYEGDIGVPYYHKYSMIGVTSPLFEFGSGLSYTNFTYSNISCNATLTPGGTGYNYTAKIGDFISVNVNVANTGPLPGKETVLVYLSDMFAQVTPEVKMLRNFNKIDLAPGEASTQTFVMNPYEFSFIGLDNKVTIESGQFVVAIGTESIYINLI
eukprot:gene13435-15833_t